MALREYKRPDVNAPRVRHLTEKFPDERFYDKFCKDNPSVASKYPHATALNKFIKDFNVLLTKEVLNSRDGVELPFLLGHIFLGVYKGKQPIERANSDKYEKELHHDNFHSDGYNGRIFYTNYKGKRSIRLKNGDCWYFEAGRDFKRSVKTVLTDGNWKKYAVIPNMKFLSEYIRKQKVKYSINKKNEKKLDYDEFKFDD